MLCCARISEPLPVRIDFACLSPVLVSTSVPVAVRFHNVRLFSPFFCLFCKCALGLYQIMAELFPAAGGMIPGGVSGGDGGSQDDGKMVDLTSTIDKPRCYARNEASGFPMSNLFIGDSRLGCKSDADEQLILHIAFQEVVKVRENKNGMMPLLGFLSKTAHWTPPCCSTVMILPHIQIGHIRFDQSNLLSSIKGLTRSATQAN